MKIEKPRKMRNFLKKHKKLVKFLSVVLIILFILGVYVGIGAYLTKKTIDKLQVDAAGIKTAQKSKSLVGIQNGLSNIKSDISLLQGNLSYFIPFRYIPFLGGYYNNAYHLLNASTSIDEGAIKIAGNSTEIANALGYGPNPVTGSGKIGIFVQNLPQVVSALNNSLNEFNAAKDELALVDPNYLPSVNVKGINVKDSFSTYDNEFNQLIGLIPQLTDLAPKVQFALGDPITKNYLLIFQNDKEIRSNGGFITAYGFLNFKKGNLGDIHTSDVYSLDELESLDLQPPVQLVQYNSANRWYLRDANLSPDTPTNVSTISKFYYSVPGAAHVDGAVFIDTQFVASLLDAVGPIKIPGYSETITSSNAAYYMEYYAEKVDINKCGNSTQTCDRKAFINKLLTEMKSKIFAAQGDQLVKLLQIVQTDLDQKHLILNATDQQTEDMINQYNWGGVFPQNTGSDFFAMVENNLGGAKADFYIKRNIVHSVKETSNGLLDTATITFTNNQVYDDWLNGPYRAWIMFYLPKGSQFVSLTGVDGTLRQYDNLGYSVVDDHISVPVKYHTTDPATKLVVTLEYYLPSTILANNYSLYVWKQPGVEDMNVTANYKNQKLTQDMFSDNTFKF